MSRPLLSVATGVEAKARSSEPGKLATGAEEEMKVAERPQGSAATTSWMPHRPSPVLQDHQQSRNQSHRVEAECRDVEIESNRCPGRRCASEHDQGPFLPDSTWSSARLRRRSAPLFAAHLDSRNTPWGSLRGSGNRRLQFEHPWSARQAKLGTARRLGLLRSLLSRPLPHLQLQRLMMRVEIEAMGWEIEAMGGKMEAMRRKIEAMEVKKSVPRGKIPGGATPGGATPAGES